MKNAISLVSWFVFTFILYRFLLYAFPDADSRALSWLSVATMFCTTIYARIEIRLQRWN